MRAPLALLALLATAPALAQPEGARRDEAAGKQPPASAPTPQLTKPPELIEGAEPIYPPAAAAAGLQAEVVVRFTVDASGVVSEATVVTPVGDGFDEAALEAVRAYRFSPAEWDGKPGPIVVETTLHFEIQIVPASGPASGPTSEPTSAPAEGQALIRGTAKERGTRRRLAGVAVAVAELDLEVASDSEGRFEVRLPPGTYTIVALLPGYLRFEEKLSVAADETAETTIYLKARGGTPYETVVEGQRERLEVTRHTISRRVMTTVPGTYGDPLRVIQNLPGVARSPYGTGFLLIRGSNPDDTGVYIDGVRVPLLYHFLGGPSIVNPDFLETMDLYPGGYPTRFGGSLGGILDVTTRPTAADGFHGAAKVDLLNTGVYLRAPVGDDVSVAVAGRHSYLQLVLPFFLPEPDPGETLVVVPVYWDYQARLDVRLDCRGTKEARSCDNLSVLAFGSNDRLDALSEDSATESSYGLNVSVNFHRLVASYRRRLADGLTLELAPHFGYDAFTFSSNADRLSSNSDEKVVGLRERVLGRLRPNLRLDAGVDLTYRITHYLMVMPIVTDVPGLAWTASVGAQTFERTMDTFGLAGYAEAAFDYGRLRVLPGLRLETYLLYGHGRATLDPRLVLRYTLDDKTALKAYGGVFHQPPTTEGMDREYGNPDLLLERAVHTGLGVERKLLWGWEVGAEAYYNHRDQLVAFEPASETLPDGTIRPYFWNSEGNGRSYGLEVIVKHPVTERFYGWLSYTLSWAELQRPGRDMTWAAFDQRHNLIGVLSYRLGQWELGGRIQLTTGRPETPIEGSTYDLGYDYWVPVYGERFSGRRPTFFQLDLRVDRTWVFDTWTLGAYVDIMNATNQDNPEATQWDYRYQASAPVRGLPIVPTLGVKGQW